MKPKEVFVRTEIGRLIRATVVGEDDTHYVVEYMERFGNAPWQTINRLILKSKAIPATSGGTDK